MQPSVLSRAGLALIVSATAALYLFGLDRSPVYLGLDEAHFAVHARALADSGRDLNGDPWPLFINLADPLGDQPTLAWGASWYHPLLFYLVAAALQLLPFTEASVRMPSALIAGAINVALIYAVAGRLFRDRWLAVASAVMLAATPAELVLGRQALDYVCPLPFLLGWLWCLLAFRDTERIGIAWMGGLILGAGCYSYVSSWVMMPAFLAISWLVYRESTIRRRALLAACTGFAIPLTLLVPWLWSHPQMVSNLLSAQSISSSDAFGHGLPPGRVIQRALATYWTYFNPAFLFLTGGPSLNAATQQAGVFLLSIAVLLPVGAIALIRSPQLGAIRWVLLIGLIITPVPAALKGMPHVIQRVLVLLPFAILISAVGVSTLWRSSRFWRGVAAVLLAAMPVQFAFFYVDYLTAYRARSAVAYDRTAFVETAQVLLDADTAGPVPAFYLTAPMFDVSAKWRFYTTKFGRTDLLQRTRYFSGDLLTLVDVPPGSLAVVEPGNPQIGAAVDRQEWSVERTVADLTGRTTLVVLRKR